MTSGKCGDNLTWTLDDDGTLTISGRGKMDDYSYVNLAPWYGYFASITKVGIENGITMIGTWAFSDCKSLTSVIIPDSVTTIGAHAFRCCADLTNIIIPNSVTAIGAGAFRCCADLTNITIPNSVTAIGSSAFKGCKSLMSFIIPYSVTTIGAYTFYDCTSLTSVIIPDSVTTIGDWAFSVCTSLTSVKIPDSITAIGAYAFGDCKSLTSIKIPNFATTIGYGAFKGCNSLTNVIIPDSVTTIGARAFSGCKSLKEIHYPSGRGFEKVLSQGNNARLIPYDELPPAQVEPPVETNCTVYKNTKISRAENIAPPNAKKMKLVDENIAEIRRAAELAAMNIVMTIERDLGFSPEDVSSQNLGYDIKSTSRDGKISRLIEVKGRHIDAETVTVSRNEIDAALNNPDNFILAIVRLDGGTNETTYIRKPFELPPDRAALSVNFSIQKLVEVSNVPG